MLLIVVLVAVCQLGDNCDKSGSENGTKGLFFFYKYNVSVVMGSTPRSPCLLEKLIKMSIIYGQQLSRIWTTTEHSEDHGLA